jgi:hypothetical protein
MVVPDCTRRAACFLPSRGLAPGLLAAPPLRPCRDLAPIPEPSSNVLGYGSRNPSSSAIWWARCLLTPTSSAISTTRTFICA